MQLLSHSHRYCTRLWLPEAFTVCLRRMWQVADPTRLPSPARSIQRGGCPYLHSQLSGEHKEHRWPSPQWWDWSLPVQYGAHNTRVTATAAAGPRPSVYAGAVPRASVLLQLMAPESTSPWGLQLTTAAGHSPFLALSVLIVQSREQTYTKGSQKPDLIRIERSSST